MSIETKMAWRNIWRNPRRTVLTVSAITFASVLLVFMLSFQFGSYETMINTSVKISTGHLQVQAQKYQEKKSIRFVIPEPQTVAEIVDQIPEVDTDKFPVRLDFNFDYTQGPTVYTSTAKLVGKIGESSNDLCLGETTFTFKTGGGRIRGVVVPNS